MADQTPLYTATCREHGLSPMLERETRSAIAYLTDAPGLIARTLRGER